ncbi:MAG: hypothetical protein LBU51_03620 [Bacteroidales bacterium]|jgi:hypothetical protein|nr:hypothetical protein [Bacteroidales bacterium]
MKKVFLTLACIAFVALLGTSCKKSCTCQHYINGNKFGSKVTTENVSKEDCKAMNTITTINGKKEGYQCK